MPPTQDSIRASLWRVIDLRFADEPLSTEGAFRFPGRWHSAGRRVLYCATSESLARNERFVHLTQETGIDFVLLELLLPAAATLDAVEALKPKVNLAGWDDPRSTHAREIGDGWLDTSRALGLSVPSVLSVSERDVLLRGDSASYGQVKVARATPFRFDSRMWR